MADAKDINVSKESLKEAATPAAAPAEAAATPKKELTPEEAAKAAERKARKAAKAAAKKEKHAKKQKKKQAGVASSGKDKVTFSVDKHEDFALWFDHILVMADIVDKRYPVKGMPVMMPSGLHMHESIMRIAESEWADQDILKAQFPMCIPKTFLELEKDHVKGFESECFWVTKGGLNELEVPLALRPTSETAMYYMYAKWIHSFRDLPLKMHQTCNVFRFETKNTTPLIRVREIQWNEAHTCHATHEEAVQNLEDAWTSYNYLISECCGVFGVRLRRPEWDKFAGALYTDVLDVLLPSGKVLQSVGAHHLGQKFAKVFNIDFLDKDNTSKFVHMTCYGISTRVLASVLGVHGDNKGLVVPPRISQYQVVVTPIGPKKLKDQVVAAAVELKKELKKSGIRVYIDKSDKSPGDKFFYWEMKGVPIRMELGPRDIKNAKAVLVTRDDGKKHFIDLAADGTRVEPVEGEESTVTPVYDWSKATPIVQGHLDELLVRIKAKSLANHQSKIKTCTTLEEVRVAVTENGGFARIPYHSMDADGKAGEEKIQEICQGGEIRGFAPEEGVPEEGTKCIITGNPAKYWAYVARSY